MKRATPIRSFEKRPPVPLDRKIGRRAQQPDQRLNDATPYEQNPQQPREIARSHARGGADGAGLHNHERHDAKGDKEEVRRKNPVGSGSFDHRLLAAFIIQRLRKMKGGNHRIAHLARADLARPRLEDIRGAEAFGEHAADGADAHDPPDPAGRTRGAASCAIDRMAAERIGDVLAGDIRRRAMHRLVQALAVIAPSRLTGSMPIEPAQHRRRVRQNVSEDIARDDDVELLRARASEPSRLHRRTYA